MDSFWMEGNFQIVLAMVPMTPKKTLQVTFDPPPTFASAKAGVASNAPEFRR